VTKFTAAGNTLAYSTFLGGTGGDVGYNIAVGSDGAAYVTGATSSTDFPTQNAWSTANSGSNDVFVTKFAVGGGSLAYSTYLGGTDDDRAYGIAVSSHGAAYVTGPTYSSDFPVESAFDVDYNGGQDVFLTLLSTGGNSLSQSTYLGGTEDEEGREVAVDDDGSVYLTGWTNSADFPTQNAFDNTFGESGFDAYVTKFDIQLDYLCGDADGNSIVNISDVVYLISYIFGGGPAPDPLLSGDADCNEIVNISDAVYLIAYIFGGGPEPCAACL
jgi:hypothetical protein